MLITNRKHQKKKRWPSSNGDNCLRKLMYFRYHDCERLNETYNCKRPPLRRPTIKKQPYQHSLLLQASVPSVRSASLDSPWKLMTSVYILMYHLRESFIITLIQFLPYVMQKWTVEKLQNESEISLKMQDLNDTDALLIPIIIIWGILGLSWLRELTLVNQALHELNPHW